MGIVLILVGIIFVLVIGVAIFVANPRDMASDAAEEAAHMTPDELLEAIQKPAETEEEREEEERRDEYEFKG